MQVRVSEDSSGRLDRLIADKTGISRSQVQKLIAQGHVLIGGRPVKAKDRVKAGSLITITLPEKGPETLAPQDIPIGILYRDGSIAVVDKPPDMVVYPAPGHPGGTLMNAVLFRLGRPPDAPGGPLRPGVVHRLDKDTSGVMVIALNETAYKSLVEQFRKRAVEKKYTALVYGSPPPSGVVRLGIGRSRADRKKMSTKGRRLREAETKWNVLERLGDAALLEVIPATGRTHQIRVHLSAAGHPVLGDKTYGQKTRLGEVRFPRQMLHASSLGLVHPVTGKYMEFKSPIPPDMKKALRQLRAP